jgi:hypothetical protein
MCGARNRQGKPCAVRLNARANATRQKIRQILDIDDLPFGVSAA